MKKAAVFYLLVAAGIMLITPREAKGWECADLQERIWELLEEDYCRRPSDCVSVQLARPFGCNRHINTEVFPELEDTWYQYNRSCGPFLYNCLAPDISLQCVDGRCQGRRRISRTPSIGTLNEHGRPYHSPQTR